MNETGNKVFIGILVAVWLIAFATGAMATRGVAEPMRPERLDLHEVKSGVGRFLKEQGWDLRKFQGVVHDGHSTSATVYFLARRPDDEKDAWGNATLLYIRTSPKK